MLSTQKNRCCNCNKIRKDTHSVDISNTVSNIISPVVEFGPSKKQKVNDKVDKNKKSSRDILRQLRFTQILDLQQPIYLKCLPQIVRISPHVYDSYKKIKDEHTLDLFFERMNYRKFSLLVLSLVDKSDYKTAIGAFLQEESEYIATYVNKIYTQLAEINHKIDTLTVRFTTLPEDQFQINLMKLISIKRQLLFTLTTPLSHFENIFWSLIQQIYSIHQTFGCVPYVFDNYYRFTIDSKVMQSQSKLIRYNMLRQRSETRNCVALALIWVFKLHILDERPDETWECIEEPAIFAIGLLMAKYSVQNSENKDTKFYIMRAILDFLARRHGFLVKYVDTQPLVSLVLHEANEKYDPKRHWVQKFQELFTSSKEENTSWFIDVQHLDRAHAFVIIKKRSKIKMKSCKSKKFMNFLTTDTDKLKECLILNHVPVGVTNFTSEYRLAVWEIIKDAEHGHFTSYSPGASYEYVN